MLRGLRHGGASAVLAGVGQRIGHDLLERLVCVDVRLHGLGRHAHGQLHQPQRAVKPGLHHHLQQRRMRHAQRLAVAQHGVQRGQRLAQRLQLRRLVDGRVQPVHGLLADGRNAGPGSGVQQARQLGHVVPGLGQLVFQLGAGRVAQRAAPGAGFNQRGRLGNGRGQAPAFHRVARQGQIWPGGALHARHIQEAQAVQRLAALAVFGLQQVQLALALQRPQAQGRQFGLDRLHQRRLRRARRQLAQLLASQHVHGFDQHRRRARQQRAAVGPGQRHVQRFFDQRAGHGVQPVDAVRPAVATHARQAHGPAVRGHQIGRGQRQLFVAHAARQAAQQLLGRRVGAVLPQPFVPAWRGHARRVAGKRIEPRKAVGHDEGAVAQHGLGLVHGRQAGHAQTAAQSAR